MTTPDFELPVEMAEKAQRGPQPGPVDDPAELRRRIERLEGQTPDPVQIAIHALRDLPPGAAPPRHSASTFNIWHLGGVAWYDAPPPQRRSHRHVAQTVADMGLEEVWRCSCGAITRRGVDGWLYVTDHDERFAPDDYEPRTVKGFLRSLWNRDCR